PKGESPMTPEEKLLRAIFGEKASDVRDTSLRVPPGIKGTVVEVRVFSRRGVEKDERSLAIERAEINRLANDRDAEKAILEGAMYARLEKLLTGQKIIGGIKELKKGTTLSTDALSKLSRGQWRQIFVEDDAIMRE